MRGATWLRSGGGNDHRYFNPRAPCGARHGDNVAGWNDWDGFQPTRPLRGATTRHSLKVTVRVFQPTRPLRGATMATVKCARGKRDFNPRAPCGARLDGKEIARSTVKFQPTRPLRGATYGDDLIRKLATNFNPRAPCGARRIVRGKSMKICISTHAPLAGRDSKSVQITMHIFAITDKFQMLLHRMPPVRAFCSFLMQENHADFGCEPPK